MHSLLSSRFLLKMKNAALNLIFYRNNEQVTLRGFTSLNQLKFNCSSPIEASIIEIKPKIPLLLDNSLKLNRLVISPTEDVLSIMLTNFRGYELNSNPFKNFKILKNYDSLYILYGFTFSNFDFYSNGILLGQTNCNEKTSASHRLFTQIHILFFKFSTTYSDEVCPYAFRNAEIFVINLGYISSTLLQKSTLGFLHLNEPVRHLNCTMHNVQFYLYHIEINAKILNEHVFKNTAVLDLNGIINFVQDDIFKNLNNLRVIRIRSQHIKNLFVRKNKWLDYINFDKKMPPSHKVDIKKVIDLITVLVLYQSMANVTYYDFPDEDICYFKNFPHFRYVLPDLKPTEYSKCSCTELFLLQFVYEISNMIQYNLDRMGTTYYLAQYYSDRMVSFRYSRCFDKNFKKAVERCSFSVKLFHKPSH